MTNIKSNESKNNAFKLSIQVKNELSKKGYSTLFNYSDYIYYKAICKNAFNKVHEIVNLFIWENNAKSDFDEYVF